jgi:hypothetical protein
MKTIIEKRVYARPLLECVKMDNEISLALESPPQGPDESSINSTFYFNNDPYKTNLV